MALAPERGLAGEPGNEGRTAVRQMQNRLDSQFPIVARLECHKNAGPTIREFGIRY